MIELPPYRRCWLIHYHSTSMWIQADPLICMWGTDRNACAAFTVTVPFIIMRSFCEISCTFLFLCLCVCLSVNCQKKVKRKYSYRTFNLLLYSSLFYFVSWGGGLLSTLIDSDLLWPQASCQWDNHSYFLKYLSIYILFQGCLYVNFSHFHLLQSCWTKTYRARSFPIRRS